MSECCCNGHSLLTVTCPLATSNVCCRLHRRLNGFYLLQVKLTNGQHEILLLKNYVDELN